ncbi:MAG: glycerol-3-phosphate acyltransferase, partial [Dehalococcoidia bacterium]|nr:glycerol-3-phosphate acyltransferase [Dehalococcoidia bacterium]
MGFIGLVVLGYLIGSIPSGVIVSRLARGIDVRDYGSGGMGMTNVLRTVGARAGVLV